MAQLYFSAGKVELTGFTLSNKCGKIMAQKRKESHSFLFSIYNQKKNLIFEKNRFLF